ncbi:MAG: hypothetical protein D6732_19475 [Methanobacteriota archaeon]|nr:MAG: hypothetical protein D6732_19475 [Euryarchaeota archaeon]
MEEKENDRLTFRGRISSFKEERPKTHFVVSAVIILGLASLFTEALATISGNSLTATFNFASITKDTLFWGSIYLAIGMGLTLTYRTLRFANFAHAEFLTIGGYVAIFLQGLPLFVKNNGPLYNFLLPVALLGAFVISGLIAIIADIFVFKPLRDRNSPPQTMMISSLGLALVLRSLIYLRFGGAFQYFTPRERDEFGSFLVPTIRYRWNIGKGSSGFISTSTFSVQIIDLIMIAIIFLMILGLFLFLQFTKLGKAIRATASNPDLAASSGINVEGVYRITWFISGGFAGFGGAILASTIQFKPDTGAVYLLPAFAVIVLGSVGSLVGAFFSAYIIGFARAFSDPFLGAMSALPFRQQMTSYRDVVPFVFLIIILLFFSEGIGFMLEEKMKEILPKILKALDGEPEEEITKAEPILVGVKTPQNAVPMGAMAAFFEQFGSFIGQIRLQINSMLFQFFKAIKLYDLFIWLRNLHRSHLYQKWYQLTLFVVFMLILALIAWLQPAVNFEAKRNFLLEFIIYSAIFSIFAISLNIHTGYTGLVNFGVVFFAGIGAITSGLLISKYHIEPLTTMFIGIALAMVIGYLLAFPTLNLRTDYFAIVTISLGEVVRIMLNVEPWLKFRTADTQDFSVPGIANIRGFGRDWWEANFSSHYFNFLAGFSVIVLILIFFIVEYLVNSPYGRVWKTIREDEDVAETYGYDVFKYKATSLAIGAGVAAAGGAMWAWLLVNIFPDLMNPVSSTFLVWGAFILGGKGNNKGMIVGSTFLALTSRVVRNLSNVNRDKVLIVKIMDDIFRFFVVDVGGFLFGNSSWQAYFGPNREDVVLDLTFLQILAIGVTIIVFTIFFNRGLIPEMPYRPPRKRMGK